MNKVKLLSALSLTVIVLFFLKPVFLRNGAGSKSQAKASKPVQMLPKLIIEPKVKKTLSTGEKLYTAYVKKTLFSKYADGKFYVLVFGNDDRYTAWNTNKIGQEGRADAIHVFEVDMNEKKITLVSVPRDTLVRIPGVPYPDKINHAYMYGRIRLLRRTVERFLGVNISYYARANFATFGYLSEKIFGYNHIKWVRNRKFIPAGDPGRAYRQQLFLIKGIDYALEKYRESRGLKSKNLNRTKKSSFLENVRSWVTGNTFARKVRQHSFDALVKLGVKILDTDLPADDLMLLAEYFKSMQPANDIPHYIVNGHGKMQEDPRTKLQLSYYIPYGRHRFKQVVDGSYREIETRSLIPRRRSDKVQDQDQFFGLP